MSDRETYTLVVNGQPRQVTATPKTLLMDVLRDQLRLTGVKDGCATGHCGSCMVIKDGEAVRSCLVPMKRADRAAIITVEGLAGPGGQLHPVQRAYIDQGATQCGFCTPGFIMSAVALLESNPKPTPEQIRAGLNGNLCRCGTYARIFEAVADAAGKMQRGG
jgi:aerobic-type carbon monoxide dehydrogenase small subunit (CoxS/CutS family)